MKIIHSLPGRLRLEISPLYRNQNLAALLPERLILTRGMVRIRANHHSGRILVEYSPDHWTEPQIREEVTRLLNLKDLVQTAQINKVSSHKVKKELAAYELESLPIIRQAFLTAFSGAMLVLSTIKERNRQLRGDNTPKGIFNLGSAFTIVTGYPIFRTAFEHLMKKGRLSSEMLAGTASIASLLKEENRLSLLVIWLVYLSTLVRTLSVEGSRDRIRLMLAGKKPVARVQTPTGLIIVPGHRVAPGALIISRAGDRLAVDGRVSRGNGLVDMCPVVNNGGPTHVGEGDIVFAGSRLIQGSLEISVEKVGKNTQIAMLIREYEKGRNNSTFKSQSESLVNKFSFFSLAAAGGLFAVTGNAQRAVNMLIVGAPSAAGMASSLPLGFTVGKTAGRGVLVKGDKYIDLMGRASSVLFDRNALITESGYFDREALELLGEAGVTRTGVFKENGELNADLPDQAPPDKHSSDCDYQEKVELIRRLQKKGLVAVVVDGSGEAQVLSAANVGISISQGSDWDLQTAGIVIVGHHPRQVAWLKRQSIRSLRTAKQNTRFSIGTNILSMTLAAFSLLSPATMAILQNANTLSLLLNSARLLLPDREDNRKINPPAEAAATMEVEHQGMTNRGREIPDDNFWQDEPLTEIISRLKTNSSLGLTSSQAGERLKQLGSNLLPSRPQFTILGICNQQMQDHMSRILLALTGISLLLGKRGNAMMSAGVLLVNTSMAVFQDRRTNQSLLKLGDLIAPSARVIRDGKEQHLLAQHLVPGDVITLQAGDRIPDDARLFEAKGL
ncbi:MAG: P-type ATPase, partial [Bacillota bacterium]